INANLKYMDKNRKKLTKSYPDFETFRNNFQIPENVIEDIFTEGEKQKITPANEEERAKTRDNIRFIMKALVARDLWDMSEYFAIIYENDEVVKKAIELLSK
ncbi:MAG: peptidase S41, partial [Bacteroidaceae bacterium]|nr:peptidase S41 [Bacteroidaceae bacterium]